MSVTFAAVCADIRTLEYSGIDTNSLLHVIEAATGSSVSASRYAATAPTSPAGPPDHADAGISRSSVITR